MLILSSTHTYRAHVEVRGQLSRNQLSPVTLTSASGIEFGSPGLHGK